MKHERKMIRAVIVMVLLLTLCISAENQELPLDFTVHARAISVKDEVSVNAGVVKALMPVISDGKKEMIAAPERERLKSSIQGDEPVKIKSPAEPEYTEEIRYKIWLVAKTIYGEAGNTDEAEKYRVGTVLMNRYERSDYPNDLESVIAEGYSCYKNWYWNNGEPTEEEYRIAEDIVVNGTRVFDKTVVWQMQKWKYGELVYDSGWHKYSSKPLPE